MWRREVGQQSWDEGFGVCILNRKCDGEIRVTGVGIHSRRLKWRFRTDLKHMRSGRDEDGEKDRIEWKLGGLWKLDKRLVISING